MKSVVIMDDDVAHSARLAAIIGKHPSFNVVAKAVSGLDGQLFIEHYHPDIVVLDIMMPESDGLKVIEYIRENFSNYQPYLYIITAMDTSSMFMMLQELDVDFVDIKPIKEEKVYKVLDEILSDTSRATKNNVISHKKRTNTANIIEDTMFEIGVPPKLLGHLCIKTALYFVLDHPNGRPNVYKFVSTVLNMTKDSVDKNIRTAIDACMHSELYRTLFGKYKESNLNFLYGLALYIQKRMRESEGK